jgi:plasmid stabilization system protein ParE
MDFQVVWAASALSDVEAIVRYLARRSPMNAERIGRGLFERAEILATLPFIGATFVGDPSGQTRELLHKKFRIFCRVDD